MSHVCEIYVSGSIKNTLMAYKCVSEVFQAYDGWREGERKGKGGGKGE